MNEIKSILESVANISYAYDEKARKSGENFNIFSILQMESNEVYTHSGFIAELLNPKGTHGQGNIFLKKFLEGLRDVPEINVEKAKVTVEKFVGKISADLSEGGFIDILIEDGKNTILIENKIYASDQNNQLVRYKNRFPEGYLLYLTLDGRDPSKSSSGELERESCFYCISYETFVINWLEHFKDANFNIHLKSIIVQYVNLIKKLTNKIENQEMKEEVFTILKNDIASSFLIAGSLSDLKTKILNDFISLIKDFSEKHHLKVLEVNGGEVGIYVELDDETKNDFQFGVITDDKFTNMFYGIWYSDKTKISLFEQKLIGYEINEVWLLKTCFHNLNNDSEAWTDMARGENSETYREIVNEIGNILKIKDGSKTY